MSKTAEELIKEIQKLEFEEQLKVAESLKDEVIYSILRGLAVGMGYDMSNLNIDNAVMGFATNDDIITSDLEYELSTVLNEAELRN